MNVPKLRFKDDDGKEFPSIELNTLGDVSDVRDGTHDSPKYQSHGHPLITSKNLLETGEIDLENVNLVSDIDFNSINKRSKVDIGDILFGMIGTIGNPVMVKSSNFAIKNVALIKQKEKLHNVFLVQYLKSNAVLKQFDNVTVGNTQKFIALGKLRQLQIQTPCLNEQTKIANFLTAVDEKISLLTQKSNLLVQYKKGVMQKIFSQELRFKDDDGREFPEWEESTLGEIAKFRRGSFPQPYGLAKWYDDTNGMPFIQVFDVDDNFKLKASTKRRISKEAQQQSVFVKAGSLLVTIQGSIGRIAVTQYDAYVDRTLLLFESFKVKINTHYFAYILFLLFEIEKEKAPGGIIKTITKEVLTDFKVFICDFKEQTKIANFLSAIDDKITQTQAELDAVKQYKQGLLQQMFV